MMRWLCLLLACASSPLPGMAQPPLFDPGEHFYRARGVGVKVDFAIEPKEIALGDEFTLTLTVRSAFNPTQIVRPDLSKLLEFAKLFAVTDVPGKPPKPTDRDVAFLYKLRPRSDGTLDLPRLAFKFLTPADRVNTTYTQGGLSILVKPSLKPPHAIVPLEAPETWLQLDSSPRILARTSTAPQALAYLFLFALGLLVGSAWFLVWQRVFPDAATLTRLQKSRAARVGFRALVRAEHATDQAEAVASIMREYLRSRGELSSAATTPREVHQALANRSEQLVAATVKLLERCDAARFSPGVADSAGLTADACDLIAAWEAA